MSFLKRAGNISFQQGCIKYIIGLHVIIAHAKFGIEKNIDQKYFSALSLLGRGLY